LEYLCLVDTPPPVGNADADPKLLSYTQVMYGLQLVAVAGGMVSLVTGMRTFLFALPACVALVLNVLRRSRVRGTWLDSHFDWQLRSFSWALFWVVMATLAFGSFALIITRIPFMEISFLMVAAWYTLRAVRGWRQLRGGHRAPLPTQARTA